MANYDNTNVFLPTYPNDKIVGVYSGSFDAGTQTTQVSYTLAGFPYSVWWYKIPHTFQQPVFCDLMTSTDGTNYSLSDSIAMSDDSFLYIYAGQGSAPSGTIYYRLVASWIDTYNSSIPYINSGTNLVDQPAIDTVLYDANKIFDSRDDYRKVIYSGVRHLYSGNSQSVFVDPLDSLPVVKVYMECLQNQVWTIHSGGAADAFFFDDSMQTGSFYYYNGPTYLKLDFLIDINTSGWSNFVTSRDGTAGTVRYWYKVTT